MLRAGGGSASILLGPRSIKWQEPLIWGSLSNETTLSPICTNPSDLCPVLDHGERWDIGETSTLSFWLLAYTITIVNKGLIVTFHLTCPD